MSSGRPNILNRSSTQTIERPTQEDQIRGYRAMTRGRYQAARATRRVFGRNNYNITLESAVDPERKLELSRERRANFVPAEVLYSNNRSLQHIHFWDIHVKVYTASTSRSAEQTLCIDDFHNHVEVAIQTHGYDTWQGGESNLLVTMAMIGRLSNTSYMGFQYSVDNVVDHLITTGITAILGERRSVEELEGMSWNLRPSEQISVQVPSRVAVNERLNRSLSLQFERYRRAPQPARYSVDQHDREILDFLDEYLPQWDDQLAIQKQKSKIKWENPFAAKRSENHTVLHLSKNEEKDDDLPYPKFRKFKQLAAQIINKHEENAFPTATDAESSTSYQPPPKAIIGPAVYPQARQNPQPTYKPDYQFGYPQGRGNTFNGGYDKYHNSQCRNHE
ncbi:hypothetical protein Tco_1499976 [Tanacetum coccineum]